MHSEFQVIPEHNWHSLIPQNYQILSLIMKLEAHQSTVLIESEKTPLPEEFFTGEQMKAICE